MYCTNKRSAITFILFVVICNSYGQFNGIASFFYDTVLRQSISKHRVAFVTETTFDTASHNNGFYQFDKRGRVIEINTKHGGGYNRKQFAYDEKGNIVAEKTYHTYDTSKVEFWKKRTYDEKNRIILEEKGQFYGGVDLKGKSMEVVYTKEKDGREKYVYKTYTDYKPKPTAVTLGYDSAAGEEKFNISYRMSEEQAALGQRKGEKTLIRTYTKNGCQYSDFVTYMAFGKNETIRAIKTNYQELDSLKHLLEYGEITYEEAYDDYAQEHPEEYSAGFYSKSFLRAIFEGKITGTKKPEMSFVYDANNRLSKQKIDGWVYTMRYNAKGQLSEQVLEGDTYTTIIKFWYNKNGLPEKTETVSWVPGEKETTQQTSTASYTYNYY